jgi:D-glycero-alpha-D-manno-heptose-7-phosphate kinase
MIIVKSPLRISLGGGGTDLPNYYQKKGGQVISTTIDKYVYLIINKPFSNEFILKYSENEKVKKINDIKHKIIKQILGEKKYKCNALEITVLADVPARTGLGSSGAFTTAIIKALNAYFNLKDNKEMIASYATKIEQKSINKSLGLQDQYASSYGGFNFYKFNNFSTNVSNIKIEKKFKKKLEKKLLLVNTNMYRSSFKILKDQNSKLKNNQIIIEKLDRIKEIAVEMKNAIIEKDMRKIGNLLNEQWHLKKNTSPLISNDKIDSLIEFGLQNGALGCKLLGAGGGGFLLFLAEDKKLLRAKMKKKNISELPFKFENDGVQIILKK